MCGQVVVRRVGTAMGVGKNVVCVPGTIYLAPADVAAPPGLAQNRPPFSCWKAPPLVTLGPYRQLSLAPILTQRTEMRTELLSTAKQSSGFHKTTTRGRFFCGFDHLTTLWFSNRSVHKLPVPVPRYIRNHAASNDLRRSVGAYLLRGHV